MSNVPAQLRRRYAAERRFRAVGLAAIVFSALKSGAIDLYPEYTGTLAFELLRLQAAPDLDTLRRVLGEQGLGSELRARLGRVGVRLTAADLIGSRTDHASGQRTLTIRRVNELSASAAVLGGVRGAAGGVTRGTTRPLATSFSRACSASTLSP